MGRTVKEEPDGPAHVAVLLTKPAVLFLPLFRVNLKRILRYGALPDVY